MTKENHDHSDDSPVNYDFHAMSQRIVDLILEMDFRDKKDAIAFCKGMFKECQAYCLQQITKGETNE